MDARLEPFLAAAAEAAAVIRAQPKGTAWLLACDTDADGLCAAAVMAQALRHAGHRFTVRASREKDEKAYVELAGGPTGLILLDKGTSHAGLLAKAAVPGHPILVIDHHSAADAPPPSPHFFLLNPRLCGLDGSRDASGATTAAACALALAGDAALPWAVHALSGAIGDWQHGPRWQGWNLEVLERARGAGLVRAVMQPRLVGPDLVEALSHSAHHLPGLEGDPDAGRGLLESEGLDPAAEVEDLSREEQARLVSALALRLLAAGRAGDVEGLVAATDHNVRLGTSLRHVFRIVDACGREGRHATGIAYLMGDSAARGEALALLSTYKRHLVAGLGVLREKGTEKRRAVQVAWTERADYTGMVAGIGMVVRATDRRLPLCVLARRPDGLVQVSTRGTEDQVRAGMDLGRAVGLAASRVRREGGGHPVAAGAVLAEADVPAFLDALDEALVAQRFVEAA